MGWNCICDCEYHIWWYAFGLFTCIIENGTTSSENPSSVPWFPSSGITIHYYNSNPYVKKTCIKLILLLKLRFIAKKISKLYKDNLIEQLVVDFFSRSWLHWNDLKCRVGKWKFLVHLRIAYTTWKMQISWFYHYLFS